MGEAELTTRVYTTGTTSKMLRSEIKEPFFSELVPPREPKYEIILAEEEEEEEQQEEKEDKMEKKLSKKERRKKKRLR